jgi:hypothetical protein
MILIYESKDVIGNIMLGYHYGSRLLTERCRKYPEKLNRYTKSYSVLDVSNLRGVVCCIAPMAFDGHNPAFSLSRQPTASPKKSITSNLLNFTDKGVST